MAFYDLRQRLIKKSLYLKTYFFKTIFAESLKRNIFAAHYRPRGATE